MPPVIYPALVVCDANTFVLCPHGEEAPVDMTASSSILIRVPKACMGLMLPVSVRSSLSSCRDALTHVLLLTGSHASGMSLTRTRACGWLSQISISMARLQQPSFTLT